jgi:hypothetical protein
MCTTHVDHRVAGQPLESTITIDITQVSLWTSTEFEIGSNFEFFIRRNREEIAMRVERERRIGKSGVCDNLPITRRQPPGAARSGTGAKAGQPPGGGKKREYKARTQVKQRNAPFTRSARRQLLKDQK